ncbi:hypothetical protein ACSVH2_13990, partial [Flavobacterium sp. RSB2_4_14]|uniref:hypothetical protein n=1 Tax=Flavobacterium sp. RSB2_4_14 TaxID=3447665 RepID=UPI003F2E3F22
MENYYNSLNSGMVTWFKKTSTTLFGTSTLDKTVVSTFRNSYTPILFVLLLVASLFGGQRLGAQTLANYTYATGTNGSLEDLSTGATEIMTGRNDDVGGTVTPIGFVFPFMGQGYTHFSANSNGQMMLHTSAGATAAASQQSSPSAGLAILAPMTGDNEVGNGIRIRVFGSAPNRKLVVEWNQFNVNFVNTTNAGNMQVWIEESTGIVTYMYGELYNSSASSQTRSIFIASSNTATTAGSITISDTPTFALGSTLATNTIAGGNGLEVASPLVANLGSASQGSRRFFTFTPILTPIGDANTLTFSAVTFTTTTPTWVDNSTNETSFVVTRALDAGFTTGLSVSTVTSTTSAGTGASYSLAQTGLVPGATYFYKIQAITEGILSTGITGSQATVAAPTYYWVGASGSAWQSPNSWNTLADGTGSPRTQPATVDVLIFDGAGTTPGAATTVVLQASQTIGTLQITNNTAVSIDGYSATTATITISGGLGDDLSIPAGSSLTLNHATFPVGIAFTGTGNTGLIAGTLNMGGSGSNALSSTGGTGTLVTVSGTINNGGTISTTAHITGSVATLVFTATGIYNHTYTLGGGVPTATWNVASNVNFTGLTSAATAVTGVSGQTFGNVTWNPTAQGAAVITWGISGTTTIAGNLTVSTTGSGAITLTTSGTLNVTGNYVQNAGYVFLASSTGTLAVTGNTTIASGATFDMTSGSSNATFRVAGAFTNNGTLTESGTSTASTLEFNGTVAQAVTTGTVNNNITYRINNNAGINLTDTIFIANGSSLIISSTAATPINGGMLTYAPSGTTLLYNSSTGNQTVTANEWKSSGGPFNVTINNTTTAPNNRVFLGSIGNRTISGGTFSQSAGVTILGSSNLTIGATAILTGTANATNFIANTGTGRLFAVYSGSVLSRTFPLGDITGTEEASPVTLAYTFLTGVSTVGVGVTDAQHPNDASTTNFLSRYFSFTEAGATDYTYTLTLNYPTGEISGFTNLTRLSRWNGVAWNTTNTVINPSATSVSVSGITFATNPLNNSDFTLRPFQDTYTWKGGVSGSFATASNWTPSRTTPTATDVLVFNGANIDGLGGTGAVTATSVATQTIGKFLLTNNANVSLLSNAAATITINGSEGVDFEIPAGSALTLTGSQAVSFNHTSNASPNANTATIAGTLNLNSTTASNYSATNSTTTVTGTVNNTSGSFTSSSSTLIFDAGSNYNHLFPTGGAVPTAAWNVTSNLNFPGPNSGASAITGISGQTFGNFNWNPTAQGTASINLGLTSATTIAGNLTISSTGSSPSATQSNFGLFTTTSSITLTVTGNFNLNAGYLVGATTGTGSSLFVRGNATIASGTTFDLATGATGTGVFRFNNTLTNNGTITVTGAVTGTIIFNGSTNQNVTIGTVTGAINYSHFNDAGVTLTGTLAVGPSRTLQIGTSANPQFTSGTVTYGAGAFLSFSGSLGNMFINDTVFPNTNGPTTLVINNANASPNNRVFFNTTGDRTIGTLTNTTGVLVLGTNSLTASAFSGTPSATNFVATNGAGQLRNIHTATGAITYPLGDITGTDEVSTVVLNYTVLGAASTVGVRAIDAQSPNDLSSTNYLSRYFSFTETGGGASTYSLTLNYPSGDVVGTLGSTKLNRWNGAAWNEVAATAPTSTSVAVTGVSLTTNGLNNSEFTLRPASRNYVWTGATSSDWQVATNWSPTRTTADPADELTFNGSTVASPTVTNVPNQTIARLLLTNNANVTLQSGAAALLTIAGAAGTDLDIPAGSTLSLTNPVAGISVIFTGTGNTGTIAGTLNLGGNTSNVLTTTGGTGTVVTVTGTTNVGAGSASSALLVGSAATLLYTGTATYNHNYGTGGTVPTATWGATTNLNFPGVNDGTTVISGIGSQTFGNFNWNPTAQGGQNVNLALTSAFTVAGNMTISATGTTGSLRFTTTGTSTYTVTGNYVQSNGTNVVLATTTGTPTLAIGGSTTIGASATFDLSFTGSTGTGSILQTAGDFTNNGTITETGGSTASTIRFNGTGAQAVAIGTTANTLSYSLTNASSINLTGTITITPGATFNHGSSGIVSGTGLVVYSGTGTTTLTYTGTTAKTQGLEWPTNFISSAPAIVINLTGSSPNNRLTLTGSRIFSPTTGAYTMTNGVTILGNNNLTLGSGVTFTGSSSNTNFVATNGTGQFFRTFATTGTFTFPIGDIDGTEEASYFGLSYSALTGPSTVGLRVIDAPHPNDTSLDNFVTRYFKVTESGATAYTYNATMNYPSSDFVGTPSFARMYRYTGSSFALTTGSVAGIPTTTSTNNSGNSLASDPLNGSDFTVRPYTTNYTWIGASGGDWTVGSNWSPARPTTSATTTDVLTFNSTATIINVPTQTVGKILLTGSAAIQLQGVASATLTIGGGTGTDLDIPSGTSLSLNGGNAMTLAYGVGATANIAGTFTHGGGSAIVTHNVTGAQVTVSGTYNNTGAVVNAFTGFTTSTFLMNGNFNLNVSGGVSAIVPAGTYSLGSTTTIAASGAVLATPSITAQNYGNFVINCSGSTLVSSTGAPIINGNLTVTSTGTGSYSFGTATVTVNGLTTLTAGTLTSGGNTFNFNGGLSQNGGTITTASSAVTINVGNASTPGVFTQTAGTITHALSTANAITLNLFGDATIAGTIQETAAATGSVALNFRKTITGVQNINTTGMTQTGSFTITSFNTPGINLTGTLLVNGSTPASTFTHSGLGTISGGTFTYGTFLNGNALSYVTNTGSQTVGSEWSASTPSVIVNNTTTGVNNRVFFSNLSGDRTITNLTQTAGILVLGANSLTVSQLSGGGATSFVATNGLGQLRFAYPAAISSATFPVGDITNTDEYSPVTLAYTTTNPTPSTVGVRVIDGQHPNDVSATDYLARFYAISESGATAVSTATLTLTYPSANVVGNSLNTRLNRWNGVSWSQVGSAAPSSTSVTVAGIDFTALNGSEFTLRPGATQTYVWTPDPVASSASYADPVQWNPDRITPDPSDILIFDGAVTASTTVLNVPSSQAVGKIVLQNNANVTLTTNVATSALTLNGGSGDDLDIPSGSTLTIKGSNLNAITLAYAPNTTANIAGSFNLADAIDVSPAHTYNASNCVTTVTGTFTNNNAAGGGVSNTSATNFIINGTYVHNPSASSAGTIPTATVAATSTLDIRSGSNTAITFPSTNAIGNLILNNIGSGAVAPSLGLSTATVQGNLIINSTGTSTGGFAFGATPTVTVNGTTTITAGKLDLANSTTAGGTFNALGAVVMNGGSIGSNNATTATTFNVMNVGNIGTPTSMTMNTGSSITSASTTPNAMTLNLFGDFTMNTGSTVTETAAGGSIVVNFAKILSGVQNVAFGGTVSNSVLFRQSNTTGVNLTGTLTLDGAATPAASFTHASTGIISGSGAISYSGANSQLTYNGSVTQTAGLEWPATNSPANVTINNTGASATTNLVLVPFSRTIAGALTMTAGNIDLTSNTLTIGTSAAASGSLVYTSGSIRVTTGSLTRWFGTSGLPTTAIVTGLYPLASGVNNRAVNVYFSGSTITAGGTITASHTDATALADVNFLDGAFQIDKRTNASWTFSQGNGLDLGASTASLQLKTAGNAAFAEVLTTNTNLRIVKATAAASGLHANSSATLSPTTFNVIRTGLAATELNSTYYIGAGTGDFPSTFTAIASLDWTDNATWDKGYPPGPTDTVVIPSPYAVAVTTPTGAVGGIVTINSGASVASSSTGVLTLTGLLTNNGTVTNLGTISSTNSLTNGATGTITSNGNLAIASTFTNNGTFTINSGTANFTTSATAVAATGITNNTGASFVVNGGTVSLGISDNTVANRTFNNLAGTLTVSGGTLNVYGNLISNTNSFFNQSGGNITIDGNAGGNATNSVASGTALLTFFNPNTRINLTGGTLTIVDPHTATTNTNGYALFYSNAGNTAVTPSANHTIRFGNTTSTDAGGHSNGFYINNFSSSAIFGFGSLVVNGPTGTNRNVTSVSQIYNSGDTTINSGGFASISNLSIARNLTVNLGGTLLNDTALFARQLNSDKSTGATNNAQTISNLGTLSNLASSPTANLASFTTNNISAGGITLASPLSISGTLTMTSGVITTTTSNLLTLGTATAAGTLSVTPSATNMIVGPFARTFAASRTASGTYNASTLFPVGKNGVSYSLHIDPTTTAGGSVVFTGEAFDTNSGSFSAPITALSSRRFEALPNATTNLTNVFVRLSDATVGGITATSKIVQAPSAAGAYTAILPATTSVVDTRVTTATPILVANYTGYLSYASVGACSTPLNQATALVVTVKTTNTVSASFTAAASAPTGYLVVRYPSGGTVTNPVDNTVYTAGASLGAGTIVSYGTTATFTASGLIPSTTYDFYVYSYNDGSNCTGPVYLTTSPLFQSITTCGTSVGVPGTPSASAILTTGFTASWSASSTSGVTYVIDVATDAGFTSLVAGNTNLNVGSVLTYPITGLTGSTTYYVRVRAVDGLGCTSVNSGTLTANTACIGTPNVAVATITSSLGCVGDAFTVSATGLSTNTGISNIWQSSPDNTNWTDISGATGTSYLGTSTVAGTVFYRLKSTCINGGSFSTSNVLSFFASATCNSLPITGSVTYECGSNMVLLDSGGSTGSYSNSSTGFAVLSNSGTGTISLSGTFTGLESCCDNIRIYSGVGVGGTLLYTYTGTGSITPFTSPVGTAITVQLNSDTSTTGAGFAFNVVYGGTCAPCTTNPTAPVATTILDTSATISWTAARFAPTTGYQYFFSTSNTPPANTGGATVSGITTNGTTTTAELTGLTILTPYFYWVRSYCSPTEFGSWVAGTFTTLNTLCSGSPVAGSINQTTISVCSGTTIAPLVLTGANPGNAAGISYQWEQSTTGVGETWSNAVGGTGATTTSYTPPNTIGGTLYYRCKVTCSNGPAVSYSSNTCSVSIILCTYNTAYTPSGVAYNSIISTGTVYSGWQGTSADDNTTTTVPLTTTFVYQGVPVTGFQACTNGWMTFNTANTSTAYSNGIGLTTPNQILAPFWDDLVYTGQNFANRDANMRYTTSNLNTGNGVITIEWAGMERLSVPGPNLNFQVKLYENGNRIEFIYGTFEGFDGTVTSAYSYSVGYNGTSPGTVTPAGRFALQTANANHFSATSDPANLIVMPACNSMYTLTPGTYTGLTTAPAIAVPSNDERIAAINLIPTAIPPTSLCGSYYTSRGATNSNVGQSGCTTTAGNEDDDVWFSFAAVAGKNYNIKLRSAPVYDGVLQLFGTDGTTSIACVNATGAGSIEDINTSGLATGTYFIRVFHNGTTIGSSSGEFAITVNELISPPTNDEIVNATDLTVTALCNPTASQFPQTTVATASTTLPAACNTADDDVWYSFTATSTLNKITVQSGTGYNASVQILSSSDDTATGTLTQLACINATTTAGVETYSGPFVLNKKYFIRVYHAPVGAGSGNFTICVTRPVPACTTNTAPVDAIDTASVTPTLTWTAATDATSYDVYLYPTSGAVPTTPFATTTSTSYTVPLGLILSGLTQYTWFVVPTNSNGAAPCSAVNGTTFTTVSSCTAPTALTIGNINPLAGTADLSWTAPTIGATQSYQYILTNTNTAPVSGTGTTTVTGTTVPGYGGLVQGTTYYLWVRTYCGGTDYSAWASSSAVTIPVVVPSPWLETFDGTTIAGFNGYSFTNSFVGNFVGVPGNPDNTITGQLFATTTTYNFQTVNVGPVAANQTLSFDYGLFDTVNSTIPPASGSGNFIVQISTDFGATYTNLETVSNDGVYGFRKKTYPLNLYGGSIIRVRILATRTSGNYILSFDNLSVQSPCSGTPNGGTINIATQSVCTLLPPTALTVTGASVDVGITYEWEQSTNGGTTWVSAVGGSGANTTTYSPPIYAGTPILYRMKTTCVSNSSYTSNTSLVTGAPRAVPFTEPFDSLASVAGWNAPSWDYFSNPAALGNTGGTTSGNANIILYSLNTTANLSTAPYGPIVSGQILTLDYSVSNSDTPYAPPANGSGSFQVLISTDCGANYVALATVTNDGVAGYRTLTYPLSSIYEGQNVLVKIAATWVSGTYTLSIDNLGIITPPPTIASFAPTSICAGTAGTIVVTGTNFNTVNKVEIGTTEITTYTIDSSTQITITLPQGNTLQSGVITLTNTAGGRVNTPSNFTIKPFPTPFTVVGTPNTLCGDGLSTTQLGIVGNVISGNAWTTSNATVASVDGDGLVTGLTPGTAVIGFSITNNGCQTFNTNTYTVTVQEKITITQQPVNAIAVVGNTRTFTVAATGAGTLSYQWYYYNENGDGPFQASNGAINGSVSTGTSFSGATTNQLTVANIQADFDTYEFYCEVSTSTVCTSVNSNSGFINISPVGIDTNPVSVNQCGMNSAQFTVAASPSNLIVGYQWRVSTVSGYVDLSNTGIYSGVTTNQLTVSPTDALNEIYQVRVFYSPSSPTNFVDSAPATFSAQIAPSVVSQSGNLTACKVNGTKEFTITTAGGVSSIQWQQSATGTGGWSNIGTNSPSLSVAVTTASPVGVTYYRALVNGFGTCPQVTSNVASLTISQPTVSVSPLTASYCTPTGTPVTLTASGTAATYSWTGGIVALPNGTSVSVTPPVTTTYTVTATDANNCTNTATATITVGNAFTVAVNSASTTTCAGAPVSLTSTVALVDPTNVPSINGYTFENTTSTYTSIVGGIGTTALTLSGEDSISDAQTLPFSFTFGNNPFTGFKVSSNGWLTFDTSATATTNYTPLSGTVNNVIAAFSRDLSSNNAFNATYFVQTSGVSPNRITKVEWANFKNFAAASNPETGNVQIWLYEGSNKIEIRYGDFTTASARTSLVSCQVGIRGASTSVDDVKSLSNTGAWSSPTVSNSSAATVDLGTFTTPLLPDNGRVYAFLPKLAPPANTYTYSWTSTPAGLVSNATGANVSPTVTTTYNLTVTAQTGCSVTTSRTITVNPLPQGSLTANGPFCVSGSGQLTFTATAGTGPYTVVYNDGVANRTATNVVSGTPFTVFTSPVTATTTYTLVSVTSASSCSRSTGFTGGTATITVNPLPQGSLTANGPFCATGVGQLTFTATAGTGPYTVVYNDGTADRTATNVVSGTPFTVFTSPVTATTTYTLVSVIGANACERTTGFTGDTATITVNSLPQGSLTANGPFCATGVGQLTFTATSGTGPYTVVYNDGTANRTATNVVSGTPFTVFTSPVTTTTTYTLVSVTTATACVRTSGFTVSTATITVSPNSTPTVTLTSSDGDNTFAYGTPVTFTATAGSLAGGSVAIYDFRVNGSSVQNGASNTYAVSNLTNGNQVSVVITVTGGTCLTTSTVTSNTITNTV